MSYCYGVDPPTIVSSITAGIPDDASTSLGTLTYQWESSTNGAAWTTITSATNVSYDPPSLVQTTWFRRVARSTISSVSFCEDVTDPVRIEILPSLNEGFVLDDQVICQIVGGGDLPNDLLLNGAEALTNSVTFQWQRSLDQLIGRILMEKEPQLLHLILGTHGYQVQQIQLHTIEELLLMLEILNLNLQNKQ